MPALTDAEARRGGSTANRWYETVRDIRMDAAGAIRLKFSISGNNNGVTEVEVDVGPKDFPTVLEIMSAVNRQEAMQAMAAELARQVQTQPQRDAELAVAARSAVHQLAMEKYNEKPVGEDDGERLIMEAVAALNREIDGSG